MRIAIYARVSTTDKEQNPETQLKHLRAIAQQCWSKGPHYGYARVLQ